MVKSFQTKMLLGFGEIQGESIYLEKIVDL